MTWFQKILSAFVQVLSLYFYNKYAFAYVILLHILQKNIVHRDLKLGNMVLNKR